MFWNLQVSNVFLVTFFQQEDEKKKGLPSNNEECSIIRIWPFMRRDKKKHKKSRYKWGMTIQNV